MLIFTMPPPSLAANDHSLCVSWSYSRYGDADAFARCSSDDGHEWSVVQRLNDDPKGNGLRQFLPHLSFSSGGRLDAIFYDRRRNLQNIGNDVYYTFSVDGGRTFSPNVRLNADPSDSRIGQRYAVTSARGQVEIGSHIGLLSRRNDVLAAWADTRNSKAGTTGQDIFLTAITIRGTMSNFGGMAADILFAIGLSAWGAAFIARRSRKDRR